MEVQTLIPCPMDALKEEEYEYELSEEDDEKEEALKTQATIKDKLQDFKLQKYREELRREQHDVNAHHYKIPNVILDRYETSLRGDLSFIDPIKDIKNKSKNVQSNRHPTIPYSSYVTHIDFNLARIKNQAQVPEGVIREIDQSIDDEILTIENDDNEIVIGDTDDDEEIESSFEKTSSPEINLDDQPIPVTDMARGKTFEQLVEDQLRKENESAMLTSNEKVAAPKKNFLRKGQGTMRSRAPIKRAPKKLSENKIETVPPTQVVAQPQPEHNKKENEKIREPYVVSKPPVRKTARLNRKEPIKKLNLVPASKGSNQNSVIKRSLAPLPLPAFEKPKPASIASEEDDNKSSDNTLVEEVNYDDEAAWSDPNDETAVTLDVTAMENLLSKPTDPNQTSNETFEQMERYCNKYYDDDDTSSINLDADPKLRESGSKATAAAKPVEQPANPLMQKLFPALKPQKTKKKEAEKQKEFHAELYADPERPKPESGAILKRKLEELHAEIKRFQKENEAVLKSKAEYERKTDELRKQVEEFEKLKNEELNNLDQYRKSERAKLKKDRRMFEDYVNTTKQNMPSKDDKQAIKDLENELEETRSNNKLKEQRLGAINNRLRSQVEVLTNENVQLKDQVENLKNRVGKLESDAQRRKAKETNRMWKEINEIVDATDGDDKLEDAVVACNLPRARYVKSPEKENIKPSTKSKAGNRKKKISNAALLVQCTSQEKKKQTILDDGSTEIIYFNDTRKVISADGKTTEITFPNGDVRTILADGGEIYFYQASGTRRTTQSDGVQVIEFPNQQVERHFIDGSKHITFPDGSSKLIRQDGYEETTLQNGTCMRVQPNGEKTIIFPNGRREIITKDFKRLELPDGTSKTVFSDGRQETKYASGRLRVKDSSGRVIIDSIAPQTSIMT